MSLSGMKLRLVGSVLWGACATMAGAAVVTFDGNGTGATGWHVAANWDTNVLPGSGDTAVIPAGQTAIINTANAIVQNVTVADGGSLTVSGRTLTATDSAAETSTGALSLNSATLDLAGTFQAGSVVLNGSTLAVNGNNAGRSVFVNQSITILNSASTLRTSGAAIIGDGVGTASFVINGSGASEIGIGSAGSVDGAWVQNSGATLSVWIDSTAQGVQPVLIDDQGNPSLVPAQEHRDGNVSFAPGSLLDVGFLGAANYGTFTVMTWEGTLLQSNLAFAPGVDTSIWSFEVSSNALKVTAQVPEPLVLAPMGIAGTLMLVRVRRAARKAAGPLRLIRHGRGRRC